MFCLLHLPGVELVFGQQFVEPDLRLAVIVAVAEAQGLFEQAFGGGRIDRIEIDARLAAQGARHTARLAAAAPGVFGLFVPAARFFKTAAQTGQIAQREEQFGVLLQHFGRQAGQVSMQGIQPPGGKQRIGIRI